MPKPGIIHDIKQISREWITECLELGGLHIEGIHSVDVEVEPEHSSTARVKISLSGDSAAPLEFICKIGKRTPGTARAEALFLRDMATAMSQPPVPACYYVAFDAEAGTACMLFEDVSTSHSIPSEATHLTLAELEGMVDTLAAIHIHWWEHERIDQNDFMQPMEWMFVQHATHADAIRSNCNTFARDGLPACIDSIGEDFADAWAPVCEQAIAAWADLFVERTRQGRGLTLTHYDPHPMNFYLPKDSSDARTLLADWEGCTRSVGVFDVSFLLTVYEHIWPEPHAEYVPALLARYYDCLLEGGVDGYSWDDCQSDYRLSMIGYLLRTIIWQDSKHLSMAIRLYEKWDCAQLTA